MSKYFIIVVTMYALMGCASSMTMQEIANADYGAHPDGYEKIIKGFMFGELKDPVSAQYQMTLKPKKARNSGMFGYAVCANINAKNGFGGYTGAKLHYFMLRNGIVVQHTGGGERITQAMARALCKNTPVKIAS